MPRSVLAVAGSIGASLAALAFAGAGPAGDARHRSWPSLGLEQLGTFDEFPLYSAGDRVDGLPLVAVVRRNDTANFVSFVYGDCTAGGDAGCAPPAEIQVWPACLRNPALYDSPLPGAPVLQRATVRGVPAAFFDDGTRLEIQTGRSTVVVFGDSRARVLRIADALRPVNPPLPIGPSLPSPAPGALEGALLC